MKKHGHTTDSYFSCLEEKTEQSKGKDDTALTKMYSTELLCLKQSYFRKDRFPTQQNQVLYSVHMAQHQGSCWRCFSSKEHGKQQQKAGTNFPGLRRSSQAGKSQLASGG